MLPSPDGGGHVRFDKFDITRADNTFRMLDDIQGMARDNPSTPLTLPSNYVFQVIRTVLRKSVDQMKTALSVELFLCVSRLRGARCFRLRLPKNAQLFRNNTSCGRSRRVPRQENGFWKHHQKFGYTNTSHAFGAPEWQAEVNQKNR